MLVDLREGIVLQGRSAGGCWPFLFCGDWWYNIQDFFFSPQSLLKDSRWLGGLLIFPKIRYNIIMNYDKDLGILELIEMIGNKGYTVSLVHNPDLLFARYSITLQNKLSPTPAPIVLDNTADPAEALWQWMKTS